MAEKKNRPTEKQEKYFVERVKYWLNFFQLSEWRVDIFVGDCGKGHAAGISVDFPGMCATILLAEETPWPLTEEKIDRSAFHECCELLVAELASYSEHFVAQLAVQEAVHRLIRHLENTVFLKFRDPEEKS